MLKKIFSLIVVFSILLSSTALAEQVSLRYNLDCPNSPDGLHFCYMTGSYNIAYVYDKDNPFDQWQLYTCKYCNAQIITEGQPHFHMPISRYISSSNGGRYIIDGSNTIFIYPEDILSCDSEYLEGYRFYGRLFRK